MDKCICGNLKWEESKHCQKCYLKTLKGKNHPMYGANRKGLKNGNYKDGRSLKKYYCTDCTKELKNYLAKRCRSCHSKRINQGINNPMYGKKGILSPQWLGGISFDPYSLDWTNELREQIRKRDNYTCQLCHKKGNTVHHIDYNKQNCKEDNLITLCRRCHNKTSANRDYWFAYFTYLMENYYGC